MEPFLPKILGSLTKLIKEEATNRLHQTIADTLGLITANILDKIETTEEQRVIFESMFLKLPYSLLEK